MKEYNVKLTEKEIDLLMYVIEGYSVRVKIEAMQKKCDWDKAKQLTNECCALNSKLYRKMLKIHEVI